MRRLPDEKEDLDGARFVNEDGKMPRVDEISVLRAFANNLRGSSVCWLGVRCGVEARLVLGG